MPVRALPPEDISPHEFFTRWVPRSVAQDAERSQRLGDTAASVVFVLTDGERADLAYTIHIEAGIVRGEVGRVSEPDLQVRVDLETWRALNRGEMSAPEALLRRRLHYHGSTFLALKLHLIVG